MIIIIQKYKKQLVFFLYLFSLIVLFNSYYELNNDPSFLKRIGDYGDEGYWIHNAITKIKFDKFIYDDLNQAFFGAPLYNGMIYFVFRYFGISFFSARATSILLLILTSFLVFRVINFYINSTKKSIFYAFSFLFLYDNVFNYKWSTPVNLEITFQLLLLYFILNNKLINIKSILITFVIFLLCYYSKSTSVFILPYLLIIIFFDMLKTKKDFVKSIFVTSILIVSFCIIFYLQNHFFGSFFKNKYLLFLDLQKYNINFSFFNFIKNPRGYISFFSESLKFPNTSLLVPYFILYSYIIYKNFKKCKSLIIFYNHHRNIILLFVYILHFFLIFYITGAVGNDRRQINLIPVFFIIFVLAIEYFSTQEILNLNFKYIFTLTFVFIFLLQLFKLLHTLNINLSIAKNLYIIIFIIFINIIMLFYFLKNYHNGVFLLFIFCNLFFHLNFNRNSQTLYIANKKIQELSRGSIIYSTGTEAQHLSIENNLTYIWWIDKNLDKSFPQWNDNFNFFKKNTSFILFSDLKKNEDNYYFHSHMIPHKSKLIGIDTLYLYPKFGKSGYVDTILANHYINN